MDPLQMLEAQLRIHQELEETYPYPPLRQDETARDVAQEGMEEHHVMDLLIDEINELKPKDEAWLPKLQVLRLLLEHHMQDEEQHLFPRVSTLWDEDKCRHVARSMEELKARRRRELELAFSSA
jgi:hemerythrin superfamily protein